MLGNKKMMRRTNLVGRHIFGLLGIFIFGIIAWGTMMMSFVPQTYAQGVDIWDSDFAVIPESDKNSNDIIKEIAQGWEVWDKYNEKAVSDMSLADQLTTGVMTWDTLLDYIVYLARFLGQLGLLIAAIVIIYIGYSKAVKVFSFEDSPISNVIKGILVIASAYAIVRFLYYAFVS